MSTMRSLGHLAGSLFLDLGGAKLLAGFGQRMLETTVGSLVSTAGKSVQSLVNGASESKTKIRLSDAFVALSQAARMREASSDEPVPESQDASCTGCFPKEHVALKKQEAYNADFERGVEAFKSDSSQIVPEDGSGFSHGFYSQVHSESARIPTVDITPDVDAMFADLHLNDPRRRNVDWRRGFSRGCLHALENRNNAYDPKNLQANSSFNDGFVEGFKLTRLSYNLAFKSIVEKECGQPL